MYKLYLRHHFLYVGEGQGKLYGQLIFTSRGTDRIKSKLFLAILIFPKGIIILHQHN